MTIEDVMTAEVVTVRPDTTLKSVARELVEHRISGLPVVAADGGVVGVISEADLLVKERGRTEPRGRFRNRSRRVERLKVDARLAGDAMTSPAVTIEPHRSLRAAAELMLERGINRLPVVRNGRLVGIVTRADLVRAFARSDELVAGEVRDEVAFVQALKNDNAEVGVGVDTGEVTLRGVVEHRSTAEDLPHFVAQIPGVVNVHSELAWAEDDSRS